MSVHHDIQDTQSYHLDAAVRESNFHKMLLAASKIPKKDCLNVIHTIVELFDKHFNNVCELDIVFEFQQAYHILGKFSKKKTLKALSEGILRETGQREH